MQIFSASCLVTSQYIRTLDKVQFENTFSPCYTLVTSDCGSNPLFGVFVRRTAGLYPLVKKKYSLKYFVHNKRKLMFIGNTLGSKNTSRRTHDRNNTRWKWSSKAVYSEGQRYGHWCTEQILHSTRRQNEIFRFKVSFLLKYSQSKIASIFLIPFQGSISSSNLRHLLTGSWAFSTL